MKDWELLVIIVHPGEIISGTEEQRKSQQSDRGELTEFAKRWVEKVQDLSNVNAKASWATAEEQPDGTFAFTVYVALTNSEFQSVAEATHDLIPKPLLSRLADAMAPPRYIWSYECDESDLVQSVTGLCTGPDYTVAETSFGRIAVPQHDTDSQLNLPWVVACRNDDHDIRRRNTFYKHGLATLCGANTKLYLQSKSFLTSKGGGGENEPLLPSMAQLRDSFIQVQSSLRSKTHILAKSKQTQEVANRATDLNHDFVMLFKQVADAKILRHSLTTNQAKVAAILGAYVNPAGNVSELNESLFASSTLAIHEIDSQLVYAEAVTKEAELNLLSHRYEMDVRMLHGNRWLQTVAMALAGFTIGPILGEVFVRMFLDSPSDQQIVVSQLVLALVLGIFAAWLYWKHWDKPAGVKRK